MSRAVFIPSMSTIKKRKVKRRNMYAPLRNQESRLPWMLHASTSFFFFSTRGFAVHQQRLYQPSCNSLSRPTVKRENLLRPRTVFCHVVLVDERSRRERERESEKRQGSREDGLGNSTQRWQSLQRQVNIALATMFSIYRAISVSPGDTRNWREHPLCVCMYRGLAISSPPPRPRSPSFSFYLVLLCTIWLTYTEGETKLG